MIKSAVLTAIMCFNLLILGSAAAIAADAGTVPVQQDKTAALIDLLLRKGIITAEEAEAFKAQFIDPTSSGEAEPMEASEIPSEAPIRHAGDQVLEQEIKQVEENLETTTDMLLQRDRLAERHREDIEEKVDDTVLQKLYKSAWAEKIKIDGDIRLRYQGEFFDDENGDFLEPDDPSSLMNSTIDRHRFRYRARLNMKADIIDNRQLNVGKMEAGFRVATGNDGDPLSTNDTLGDYLNRDNILFDRAYVKWAYKPEMPIWGKIPRLTVSAGRMANPWFSTNLVWDRDLNFEGLAVDILSDTQEINRWRSNLTMGIFPLQEEEFSQRDKWFYGIQASLEIKPRFDITTKWGIAYYDYQNIEGIKNDALLPGDKDFTAPMSQQMGNTLIDIDPSTDILTALASDYDLLNITANLDIATFFPIHTILTADVVWNFGFDKDKVAARTGIADIPEETLGYYLIAKVGFPTIREYGEWNTYIQYKHLESDAVLDAFTDSDFHNGGTNAKGWILGLELGVYRNMWMTFKWLSANEIVGSPFAIDVAQIDLNARF